jgi:hypothetical protein
LISTVLAASLETALSLLDPTCLTLLELRHPCVAALAVVEVAPIGTTVPQAEHSLRMTVTPFDHAAALEGRVVIGTALSTLVISIDVMTIAIGARRIGGSLETETIEMIPTSSATSSHGQIHVHPSNLAHPLIHPSHRLRNLNGHLCRDPPSQNVVPLEISGETTMARAVPL